VARTACTKEAGTNFPHGKVYNRAMRKWLDENCLADTTSRMRTDLVKSACSYTLRSRASSSSDYLVDFDEKKRIVGFRLL
jgi:hypothetical protein